MPFLQKNQTIDLTIDGYTAEGAGVGRAEKMAVFVPGALKGETVRCLIIKCAKRYAVGKLLEVLVPSPHRTTPDCPYFVRCGGCALQAMDYAEQLDFKRQRIEDAFVRIGNLSVPCLPVMGMEPPFRYRNKGAFPVGCGPQGPAIGLFASRSHRIVPVTDCLLQSADTKNLLSAVHAYLAQSGAKPYDEKTHTGLLRHIVVRQNEQRQSLVCLVSTAPLPKPELLISLLQNALPGLYGVVQNLHRRPSNVIFGEEETLLWGKDALPIRLCGFKFEVSARSFFQVNLTQAEKLYLHALSLAGLTGRETVVDAYCGVGSMSLLFAQHAKEVIGIECVAPAVQNARLNAQKNNVSNVRFLCDLAENALPRLFDEGLSCDVLLLDPPRKGCDRAVLETAARLNIPKIVYVSCDPATQARDAAILSSLGYSCGPVQGVDMFCQTAHVESVCLLSKVNPDK